MAAPMTRDTDEPTDAEVNAAIDALRDKALRGVSGTTGHAWGERMAIRRSAELLKRALATGEETR